MTKRNIAYITVICLCLLLDIGLLVVFLLVPGFFGAAQMGETGNAVVLSCEEREEGYFITVEHETKEGEKEELSFTLDPNAIEGDPTHIAVGQKIAYGLKKGEENFAVAFRIEDFKENIASLDQYNDDANSKALGWLVVIFFAAVLLFLVAGFCMLKLCGFFQGKKKRRR